MKRRPNYPILLVLGVLSAFLFIATPKLYEYLKKEVAIKHSENSFILEEHRYQNALEKLQAAHKLDPENIDISRKLADAINKINPEDAVQHYQSIIQHPKSTVEDKLTLINTALETGAISKAETQLLEIDLSQVKGQRLEYHLLWAKVHESRGNIEAAIRELRIILAEEESSIHNSARFFFIRVAIRSTQPLLIKEAKELLHSMTLKEGEVGIEAIRFYFGISGFSEQEALDVFVKTLKHPLATTKDKLDAATLYQRTVPSQTNLIVDSIKSQFNIADADPNVLYNFCIWLATIHQWDAIAEYLTQNIALDTPKLYTLRLDALSNLQRWDDIIKTTKEEASPIPDHFRLAFLSRAYRHKGDIESSLSQMDLILDKINDDRDSLFKTCEYLEKTNESEALLYLLDKAVLTTPALEAYACSKRIRHRLATASLDELCDWYGVLHSEATNVSEFRSRKTYFDLLADKNLGEAILNAKSLFTSDSLKLEHRVIMALALVKSGKLKEAQQVLDNTPISIWRQSTVGWKMLYAHIMRANGLADRADAFLKTVPTAKLSRAEREGFANL